MQLIGKSVTIDKTANCLPRCEGAMLGRRLAKASSISG